MNSRRVTSRMAVLAGGVAIVTMGALGGCSSTKEKEAPSTVPTTPSSSAPAPTPTPTEKAVGPGDNSFSPTPHHQPGAVCNQIVNGVCMR